MKYEYEVLKLGNADAIFIRHYVDDVDYVVLIDAGNICDSDTIKDHLIKYYGTTTIDLAVCTHPDTDHMGGFFGLLEDESITISEFWLIDPAHYLDENDIKRYRTKDSATNAVRKIFNNPNNESQNLINILLGKKGVDAKTVIAGAEHNILPLKVVAPTADHYREIAKNMVEDYGCAKVYEEADTSKYDEAEQMSVEKAKSSIDTCDDDSSPYNQSSIVLLYEPEDDEKILFAGDASCSSLIQMTKDYPEINKIELLKVPHHGSKHNLSSAIIDVLQPKSSYISAEGTRKHPSSAIVNYLSKYGNVYSTHKHNGFIRRNKGITRPNTIPITPLKAKQ
ncbi:MBL fold metallo-hydrolase [Alistipes indistinctus]|uniref:ComEC/Rec2 family competence protein n=1 Tax=Alistipes indistinctus TaxID=626932 RepID=UPI0036F2C2F9